jgi:hypothetical protein
MDKDKKKGMGEAPSSSSGPSSKRFAKTHNIHEDEDASAPKMARMSSSVKSPPLNEFIALGSPVLRILMSYLDVKSLKNSRLVCKSWEDAAQSVLMTRADLNVQSIIRYLPGSEYGRVEHYSSWVLEYNPRMGLGTFILGKWGKDVTSLTLQRLTLDRSCLTWIRNILSLWCPNVASLSLEFERSARNEDRSSGIQSQELKNFEAFLKKLKKGGGRKGSIEESSHPFAPYPTLRKIQSLRVGTKSDRTSSYLTINIILSCLNLKHLFVSEIGNLQSTDDRQGNEQSLEDTEEIVFVGDLLNLPIHDRGSFRILHFLSTRPDITTKLESFEWQDNAGLCKPSFHMPSPLYKQWEDTMNRFEVKSRKTVNNNNAAPQPILQFGDSLKSLHWNVLHVEIEDWRLGLDRGRLLFPGMLEQVAGSLRKLDLRTVKMERRTLLSPSAPMGSPPSSSGPNCRGGFYTRWVDEGYLRGHSFPLMPKLSVIQIGLRESHKIELDYLVDAAPNLMTLEICGCECCDIWWMNGQGCEYVNRNLWRPEVVKHKNLKFLKTGMRLRCRETLERTVEKFPNLEELCIGVEGMCWTSLQLDSIWETLEELKSLKRFKWTICGPIDVAALLTGIAEAAGRMRKLESCHVRFLCSTLDSADAVQSGPFLQDKRKLLWNLFATETSSCKFIVTANSETVFQTEQSSAAAGNNRKEWKELLFPFIQLFGLPITFKYSPTEEQY